MIDVNAYQEENVDNDELLDTGVEIIGDSTEGTNEDEQKPDESEVEEGSIVMNVLDTLGLTTDFPEAFLFEKGFDIDSDAGITKVIEKTFELGETSVLNNIKENAELYSVFLHFQNGGNLSSFKNDNISVYSDEQLKENINLQTEIVKNNLKSKDISDDIVESIVSKLIEKEELETKALAINGLNKQSQDAEIAKKEKEISDVKVVNEELGLTLTHIVSDSINNNKFSSLRISNDEKEKLYNDLSSNIEIINGKAFYKVRIKDENIQALIENHLLLINPSLKSKLVAENKTAVKVNSLREKRNIKTDKVEGQSSVDDEGRLTYNYNMS